MNSVAIFSFEYRKQAFFVLSVLAGILTGTYLFLLNQTILDVVAVEETQKTIATLHSEVSDLESGYLVARSTVSLDTALALGFHDASSVDFLARSSEHTRLSLVSQTASE